MIKKYIKKPLKKLEKEINLAEKGRLDEIGVVVQIGEESQMVYSDAEEVMFPVGEKEYLANFYDYSIHLVGELSNGIVVQRNRISFLEGPLEGFLFLEQFEVRHPQLSEPSIGLNALLDPIGEIVEVGISDINKLEEIAKKWTKKSYLNALRNEIRGN